MSASAAASAAAAAAVPAPTRKRERQESVPSTFAEAGGWIDTSLAELKEGRLEAGGKSRRTTEGATDDCHARILEQALAILRTYPKLMDETEKRSELKEIYTQLEPHFKRDDSVEFKVFDRIIRQPIIQLNTSDEQNVRLLSSALVLNSGVLRSLSQDCPASDDSMPSETVALTKAQAESIRTYLYSPQAQLPASDLKGLLALYRFAHQYDISKLMSACKAHLVQRLDQISSPKREDIEEIVAMLNTSIPSHDTQLKNALMQVISNFFVKSHTARHYSDYVAIRAVLETLTNPITISFPQDVRDLIFTQIQGLPIEGLLLSECRGLTKEVFAFIASFSSLKTLYLPSLLAVGDNLDKLPHTIEELYIRALTEAHLPHLAHFPLKSLVLGDCNVRVIDQLPESLETLSLLGSAPRRSSYTRNPDNYQLSPDFKKRKLKELHLKNIAIGRSARNLPSTLRVLEMSDISSTLGEDLAHLTQLEQLTLGEIPPHSHDFFAKIPKTIKVLSLPYSSDESLTPKIMQELPNVDLRTIWT